jgi:hypothetical protein
MSGSGTYHLNVFDGGGGAPDGGPGGVGDTYTDAVTLTNAPHSFTVGFTLGLGSGPQIQVRVDGSGALADVDVRLWHVAIYPK